MYGIIKNMYPDSSQELIFDYLLNIQWKAIMHYLIFKIGLM